jgi:rubrerythrin
MNLRWLVFDFVDPELKLSRAQRRLVTARAFAARGSKARVIVASVAASLAWVIPMLAVTISFARAWGAGAGPSPLALELPFLAVVPVLWVANCAAVAWAVRPAVQQSLLAFGYELCRRCRYQLRGLDEYRESCPECGARRVPLACQKCGFTFPPASRGALACPACGSDQRVANDPARFWWLSLRQAPPAIDQLPARARRALRARALRASAGRIALSLLAAAGAVALAGFAWYGLLVDSLGGFLRDSTLLLTYPPLLAWPAAAIVVHRTYGRALRTEVRRLGYDICGKCGCSLAAVTLERCPECAAPRQAIGTAAPRPATLPTPEELALLAEAMQALRWRAFPRYARLGAILGILVLAVPLVVHAVRGADPGRPLWITYGVMLGWVGLLACWLHAIHARTLAQLVRSEVRRRGGSICTSCGSWLRGPAAEARRCPECAARLDAPEESSRAVEQ